MSNIRQLNRRDFLKTGGVLVLGVSMIGCGREPTPIATRPVSTGPWSPDVYISFDADGTVHIISHRSEMGQGIRTGLPAVVADEIRELAERSAVSTREIGTIISNLQEGTQEAVVAMKAGSEQVHEEVKRSKDASVALEKIRSSTLKATDQVNGIVRATEEQSRGSRQVTDSMNQVAAMLEQISTAINQQTTGSRQLAESAELMRDIAAHGKQSTSEQAKGSRQINESMEQIRSMISIIDESTRALTQRSRDVVDAVGSVHKVAEGNASRTAELDHVVETLTRLTSALEEEVGVFKI